MTTDPKHGLGRRHVLRTGLAAAATLPIEVSTNRPAAAQSRAAIFIYPCISRYADGRPLYSVQTVTVAQATTDTAATSSLSGVAIIIAWSDIEPAEAAFDFSAVDAIIDYWSRRGKRIILDVATIGYPFRAADGKTVRSATPDWLMKRATTYTYPSQVLGFPASGKRPAAFPDFRDPAFIAAVARLARAMGRFDGNRTIAQIRMPAGLLGEDNPLVGSVVQPLPWYRESLWLAYCDQTTDIFAANFRRTQMEFDVGRLGAMWARGSATDRTAVDQFVAKLRGRNTLLAFNGLQSLSNTFLDQSLDAGNGVAKILDILGSYARFGGAVGLEAAGPLVAEKMQPLAPILSTIDRIRPERVVLFPDVVVGWPEAAQQAKVFASAYGPDKYANVRANAVELLRHINAT